MATTPNNYEDERLDQVERDYQSELQENQDVYQDMIDNTDGYYNNLIEESKKWADEQTNLQNEQTQHTINQINQQKDQAHKDYVKEQSGAYVDWQKQSNAYGTEAEKMASAGLANTGFSESSQVAMYNTYQNRVATARASFDNAVLNYNNAIKDAQLQNSSILAEIAHNAQTQQLELALTGFQYKNNLVLEQANKKMQITQNRWDRYLSVLNQINTEKAHEENIRQFNETMEFNTQQKELDRVHDEKMLGLQQNFQAQQAQLERDFTTQRDALNRQHEKDMLVAKTKAEKELLDKQHKQDLAKLEQQHKNNVAMLEKEYELAKKNAVVAGGSGGSKGVLDKSPSELVADVKGGNSTPPKGSTNSMDLGLGPINKDMIAKLAAAGLVTLTKGSDGKTYYYNNSGVTRQNMNALLKLAGY